MINKESSKNRKNTRIFELFSLQISLKYDIIIEYGLINKSTVAIEPQADLMRPPATPEEIAKNLPELDSGLIDLFDTTNE